MASPFHAHADRIMLGILWAMAIFAIGLSFWNDTFGLALIVAGGTAVSLSALKALIGGTRAYRCLIGAAFMVLAALHIQQSHGTIEMHFGIFVLLAVLVYYRDWLPILVAAGVIAAHHIVFFLLQQSGDSIYLVRTDAGWPVILIHAGYVVVETVMLVILARHAARDAAIGEQLQQASAHLLQDGKPIDLTYRSAATDRSTQRFNRLLDELDRMVSRVVGAGEELHGTSSHLARTTGQLKQGAEVMQGATGQIGQAVEQLSAAVLQVSENTERAAESARKADSDAASGIQAIHDAQTGIRELAQQMETCSTVVQGLADDSQQIDRVVEVIRAVADQTNLLALNAAIEAARAGEHGRGFAVVADEVRQLAHRTQEATEEVQTLIEHLQQTSGQAVSAMEQGRKSVEGCVERTEHTAQLLADIHRSIEAVSIIGVSTREQLASAGEMARLVEQVRTVAARTSVDAATVAEDSQHLEQLAERLRNLCQQFQVSDSRPRSEADLPVSSLPMTGHMVMAI